MLSLIVFVVFFYIVLTYFYFAVLFNKNKIKKSCSKNLTVVKAFKKINKFKNKNNILFFCSKYSLKMQLFCEITNATFCFFSPKDYLKFVNPLKQSGINFFLPILKLTFYDKQDLKNKLKFLIQLKNLQIMGVKFNLYLFANSCKILNKLQFIANVLNLKSFVFLLSEINFEKLSSINYFNVLNNFKTLNNNINALNNFNVLKNNKNKNDGFIGYNTKNKNILNINNKKIKDAFISVNTNNKKINGNFISVSTNDCEFNKCKKNGNLIFNNNTFLKQMFFVLNNNVYEFIEGDYKNFAQNYCINSKSFKCVLSKTFSLKYNSYCYKVFVENLSLKQIKLNFSIIIKFMFDKFNSKQYVISSKKNFYKLFCANENCGLTVFGTNFKYEILKNVVVFEKIIVVKQKSSYEFCFYLNKTNNNLEFDFNQNCLNFVNASFDNELEKFKSNLPKTFSLLNQLNFYLNDFLPNKIIKNKVCESGKDFESDFCALTKMQFNQNLLEFNDDILKQIANQSNLTKCSLNNFYSLNNFNTNFNLILNKLNFKNSNLFKIYFNLFYNFVGVWPSNNGIYINFVNKQNVLGNSRVTKKIKNKNLIFDIKFSNLKNEISLNNVKYSNLNFLSYSNLTLKKSQEQLIFENQNLIINQNLEL